MLPRGVKSCQCKTRYFSIWRTRSISTLHRRFNTATRIIHKISPSRRSILDNDIPVITDVLRVPRLYQVTDNAIASAMMREPLEMMVTFYDDQPWISCFRPEMLTPVGCNIISDVFLQKGWHHLHPGSTSCGVTDSFPAPEWAQYWLQRIDLVLSEICIDVCPSFVQ